MVIHNHEFSWHLSLCEHPSETSMDPWERGLVVPQATATRLLVAGLAQWVCFVCGRWKEKSLLRGW
jgi:hypothetical protein